MVLCEVFFSASSFAARCGLLAFVVVVRDAFYISSRDKIMKRGTEVMLERKGENYAPRYDLSTNIIIILLFIHISSCYNEKFKKSLLVLRFYRIHLPRSSREIVALAFLGWRRCGNVLLVRESKVRAYNNHAQTG